MNREEKQYLIEQANTVSEIGEISDGFHTFNSLYNQRLYLWAALVKAYKNLAWKSIRHHDGKPCFGGGWFIVGITTPLGDYTYHYELKDWSLFDCKVLIKAPEWDGHTDKDITRVLTLQPYHVSQWIPVEEELPEENGKTGQSIRVWATDGLTSGEFRYDFDTKTWTDMWGDPFDITHWMSLPQPPRNEE